MNLSFKSASTKIRNFYAKQQEKVEAMADKKLATARTQAEKDRIRNARKHEQLRLQREKYESIEKLNSAKKAVSDARKRAGVKTFSEKLSGLGRDFKKFQNSSAKKRKTKTKRR